MIGHGLKLKSGATSFYVVAIATLILVILATSFATAIMAEIIRSANDDLAQSAYDSALAGVEEAKLAYANYQNCVNRGFTASEPNGDGEISCPEIIWWMENPNCDMVAHILGRIEDYDEGREINLEETATGPTASDLDQAYTCVEIDTNPQDIYGSLGLATPYKVIDVNSKLTPLLDTIVIKWHQNSDNSQSAFTNVDVTTNNPKVQLPPISKMGILPTPATISLQIVQTPQSFTFGQLNDASSDGSTNRATLYFIPTDNTDMASASNVTTSSSNYIGIYDSENGNYLSASQVASANNRSKNLPYVVYCDTNASENFACSVKINLPQASNGEDRSSLTFSLVLSLAYGGPNTNYSIEYLCSGNTCQFSNKFEDADAIHQVVIDSTGRAGDMFKRVEVRLDTEVAASTTGFPFYTIQANTISKNISVANEWGLDDASTPEPEPEPEPEPIIGCTNESPYMQDWDGASSLGIEQTIYLRDKRDNQCYSVAKLKDGKVWMTTNMNLAGGTQLSSNDTDMPSGYTLSTAKGFQSDNRLPESDLILTGGEKARVYNSGNTVNCGYLGQEDPCYSYYTWTAITLGSGTNLSEGVDAPYSICPKGWRLPKTRGIEGNWRGYDFYALATAYGVTFGDEPGRGATFGDSKFYKNAGPGTIANFLLTGTSWNTAEPMGHVGMIGYYYSATAHPSDTYLKTGYNLFFSPSSISVSEKWGALPSQSEFYKAVRCIKK